MLGAWDEKFRAHEVHQAITTLLQSVETYREIEFPAEGQASLARVDTVMTHLKQTLEAIDPVVVSYSVLASLGKHIAPIQSELASFVSDKAAAHLATIDSQTDAVLDLLVRISPARLASSDDSMVATATSFRHSADALLKGLEADVSALKASLAEVATGVSGASSSIEQIRPVVEQQKARLDSAIADFQKQFSESEDRRRQAFETTSEKFSSEHSLASKQDREQFQALIDDVKTQGQAFLTEIDRKRSDAVDLVQVIGNVGVTGNYKMEANAERRSANIFRWIALGAMALIVVGIGATLWAALKADATWQQVLLRLGITIALSIPAAYTARESERHRQLERRYRRLELELSSIDAYLVKIPEETRNALKIKLAERFFGQNESEMKAENEDKTVSSVLDILKLTLANLTKK